MRDKWAFLFVALGYLGGGLAPCHAQSNYPSKPVRIYVGAAPGGGIDAITRLVTRTISENNRGYNFIVDNQAGASGAIAVNKAAASPPDGYALVGGSESMTLGQVFHRFDTDVRKTLAPVGIMALQPTLLFVNINVPVNTAAELVAYAKKNPGKLNYFSTGVGTNYHLGMLRLQEMAGISMVHIPYKGGSQAAIDLASGNLQVMFGSTSPLPLVRTGKAKLLATASLSRHPQFPDVPTLVESGFPGFDMASSFRLFIPSPTPDAIKNSLNQAIYQAATAPEVVKAGAPSGYIAPPPMSPAEMMKSWLAEHDRLAEIARKAGVTSLESN